MGSSLQVVLPQLQHLRSNSLLGQLQAGGGAVHQDPGGGDGRGADRGGAGETVQAAPPRPQSGSGPRGDGQRGQA